MISTRTVALMLITAITHQRVSAITINGNANLGNEKLSSLKVRGNLNANKIVSTGNLKVAGNGNLTETEVHGDTDIHGNLCVSRTDLKGNTTIHGNTVASTVRFGNDVSIHGNAVFADSQTPFYTKINGNLRADETTFGDIKVHGSITSNGSIFGTIDAYAEKVSLSGSSAGNITLHSNHSQNQSMVIVGTIWGGKQVVVNNGRVIINGVEVPNNNNNETPNPVILELHDTIIRGDVLFTDTKVPGKIILTGNSKIIGTVTNGTVERR